MDVTAALLETSPTMVFPNFPLLFSKILIFPERKRASKSDRKTAKLYVRPFWN